ncbi:MAG: elongation factor P [Saprospiraceae bacterium]
MASTSDIKNGLCMEFNNDIYRVIEFQHVKPGKGAAFVRTKLKSCTTGRVLENTFPSGHKIVEVQIERRKYQFLYKDDMGYHFMNNETYDQIFLQETMIENPGFLQESMNVEVLFDAGNETPLTLDLPNFVELEITYTEPGIKGDTSNNSLKAATVGSGAEIRVPLFINQGDVVKVDTRTGAYLERAKK